MVHLSNTSVEELKTFRAVDDFVDALIQLCCANGQLDIGTYRKMWTALQNKYSKIKQTIDKSNQLSLGKSDPNLLFSNDFRDKISSIDKIIQDVGIDSQKLSDNTQNMSGFNETRFINDLASLTLKTNEIYRLYAQYMSRLGYRRNIMERIRNSGLGKAFVRAAMVLTLLGATGQKEKAAESRNANPKETTEIKAESVSPVTVSTDSKSRNYEDIEIAKAILDTTSVKVLSQGFHKPVLMDTVKATAYTPKGEGLKAGTNKDGSDYQETGVTSTNNDALHNFDGIAVVDSVIPYGSIVYIKGIGWKVADDTGAQLIEDTEVRHETRIDLRMNNIDDANKFGVKKDAVIIVFMPNKSKPLGMRSDTWRFHIVEEGRKLVKELNKKQYSS